MRNWRPKGAEKAMDYNTANQCLDLVMAMEVLHLPVKATAERMLLKAYYGRAANGYLIQRKTIEGSKAEDGEARKLALHELGLTDAGIEGRRMSVQTFEQTVEAALQSGEAIYRLYKGEPKEGETPDYDAYVQDWLQSLAYYVGPSI